MSSTAPPEEDKTTARVATSKRKKRWRIVLMVVGVLVLARIALPYILLHFANARLAKMPGYYGHIRDIDLALLRGAYQVEGFFLDKQDSVSRERTDFLKAALIDLSVEWQALFEGSIVGEVVIDSAEVRFTKEAADPADLQKDTASFRELLDDFMPLRINRVELHNGAIRYIDPTSAPKVDAQLGQVELLALNLTNSSDSSKVLPSTVESTASLYGGHLKFNMGLDPLAAQPTFDMNMELTQTELTRLNDLFKAYAKVDVNRGTMGLYAEMATRDGAFEGYVKPLIKDLDVLGKEDKEDPLLHKLWEGFVGTVVDIVSNQPRDQLATKVDLKGRLDDVRVSTWSAVGQTLSNAFIRALTPQIDKEVSIGTIGKEEPKKKGFLKNLFDGKDKKKADRK